MIGRRHLIAGAAAAAVQTRFQRHAWASGASSAGAPNLGEGFWTSDRALDLTHVSGDRVNTHYLVGGRLYRPGYEHICRFLRDRTTHEAVEMDAVLLDVLYGLQGWLAFFQLKSRIVIHSGHRSFMRNAAIEGAVLNSRHVSGQAVDLHIPGVSPSRIAAFGLWLGGGGVGWYPQRGFVHLDTGRQRFWRG